MLARKKVLGDYQVGKTIGQGAFSKVKIGVHKETGQKVAIKIIDKKQVAAKAEKAKKTQEDREKKDQQKQRPSTQSPHAQRRPSQAADTAAPSAPQSARPSVPSSVKGDSASSTERKTPVALFDAAPGAPVPSFVSQLQLEVQLLMRLDHPNVIRLYQVMETEDECFVVMEYAQGGELIEYIAARGHLNEKEARRYFRQIVSAMDHCHMANVVHRDLKLENLLMNGERNILISDFGLGRTYRSDQEELLKTFCGTPNYAAVELISGIPYIGVKSDIWAMGVVLFVMMTGRPPFSGDSISALYNKIKAVDYQCPEYFSQGLCALLAKILVKDPKQRIEMSAMREDPWLNYEEIERPLRVVPKVTGSSDASQIGQFITGITYDQHFVIYTFRKHVHAKGAAHELVSSAAAAAVAHISPTQKNDLKRRKSLTVASAGLPGQPTSPHNHAPPALGGTLEEDDSGDKVTELPNDSPTSGPQQRMRTATAPLPTRIGRRMSLDSNGRTPTGPVDSSGAADGKPNLNNNRRRSISATPNSSTGRGGQRGLPPSREANVVRRMSMVSPMVSPTKAADASAASPVADDPDPEFFDEAEPRPSLFGNADLDDDDDDATAVQPSQKEIETWHSLHRPPKTIRTVRFAVQSATTSSSPPSSMFQQVHQALAELARHHDNRLAYKRVEDYYMFTCQLIEADPDNNVEFEIEICKVWLLKVHGVRIKRLSGSPFIFKEVYAELVASLELSI